jgi:hypothetical protein
VDRKPSELRMPMTTVPVRLALAGHDPGSAELFLNQAVAKKSRTAVLDAVGQLVDEPSAFLPVKGARDTVRLLAKHAIAWIAINREQPSADGDFDNEPSEVVTLYDRQHHVLVELMSGKILDGTLFDSAPSDRPRVIDHLNRSGGFLRLWTSDEHYLINKDQILAVVEHD